MPLAAMTPPPCARLDGSRANDKLAIIGTSEGETMSGKDKNGQDDGKAPDEMGDLVEGLFRKRRREPVLAVSRLRKNWPGIVGDALARVTWPARLARGVLWINALDTGWAFNLQFVKSDLLQAARTFLGNTNIQEVRYKAGPVPGGAASEPMPVVGAGEAAPETGGTAADGTSIEVLTPSRSGKPRALRAALMSKDGPGRTPREASPGKPGRTSANESALPSGDAAIRSFVERVAAKLRTRRRVSPEEPSP
jgi:hypothetical protein